MDKITLKKIRVHNLKGVDLDLTPNELIVFTGVSGSGKSSCAFDTIYTEGQRRYIESLSTFARRYIGDMSKPDVEYVAGLSPTISIEQKMIGKNPRSTVGTMTEIYDYLRVLYARVGIPHCPVSLEPVLPQNKEKIIKKIQKLPKRLKIAILAPYVRGKKGEFKEDFQHFLKKGYTRGRVDKNFVEFSDELILDKNLNHDIDLVIDRLIVDKETETRIAEAVTSALDIGKGALILFDIEKNEETLFSTHAYSPQSGLYYPALEPHDFSFNSPTGMCLTCHGMGTKKEFDLDLIIDPEKSISQDCCLIASSYHTVRFSNIYNNLATLYRFNVKTPWKDLSEKAKHVFLYGTEKKWTPMHFVHPEKETTWSEYVQWRGVIHDAWEKYGLAKSENYKKRMEAWMRQELCPDCQGSKLRPYPSATLLGGKKIHEVTNLTIQEALEFFETLTLDSQEKVIAEELLKEISQRLCFLIDVGLHYLSLDRIAPTLSGGESQRVRLASQIGSQLVGVIYVLDEPSIGLHPRDNTKLVSTIKTLRDLGNTVIVVEHDEETMLAADRIVDFGPGPGREGGEILVNGTLEDLFKNKRSLTGAYLSGKNGIAIPEKRRVPKEEKIKIFQASHNNLKNVDVEIPLGVLIAITGVSGSGKSSLISETLYPALANLLHHAEYETGAFKKIEGIEHIDKVIAIDQSPIGRNPRSNPATYIKIFDEIRNLFSMLPESSAKGFGPGRFSFNVKDGSCEQCHGLGMISIDMDFMEDAWVPCTHCKSKRFDSETLSIYYKGRNIYDVLEMTFNEALRFFSAIPTLKRKLEKVCDVGMGYIKLGQPSPTLSGGEAQRIKLAKELVRPSSGNTLYILDEPTTGLHFHDIQTLLFVIQEIVDRGNTVLVIEHNMDVVKTADYVIDIGPEGGKEGGNIVGYGTPEEIAKLKTPTGKALFEILKRKYPPKIEKRKKRKHQKIEKITLKDATQNNLKSVSTSIPREKITICMGPSGSGKSSLAFETIYAEGQRRYIESLSPYARQFVKQMSKPKVGDIEGLSPSIAIEQKQAAGNPRSTIGTMTEIYDYLRLLFAHRGVAYCPETQEEIKSITKEYVAEKILQSSKNEKITILAPLTLAKNEKFETVVEKYRRMGFLRLRLNKKIYELDDDIPFDRKRKNEIALVIDRLRASEEMHSRLLEAIENATNIADGTLIVMREEEEDVFYNLSFSVLSTGKSYPPITPHSFSFNSPEGMCLDCQGLGFQYGADLLKHPQIMHLSLHSFLRSLWIGYPIELLEPLFKKKKINPNKALKELSPSELHLILNGMPEEEWIEYDKGLRLRWLGVQPSLAKAAKWGQSEVRDSLLPLLEEIICPSCNGTRLNPLARNVRIHEHSIASLCALPCDKALKFIEDLPEDKFLEEVFQQLKSRLRFLIRVGLNYLSLDRKAPTLSNGEAQRIRLAGQLGSQLTGVLYVLDEPSIGLHPEDNKKLNQALIELKDLGNTLIIVEHDPLTLHIGDHFLDFGPGAGIHGGHIMAEGSFEEIKNNPKSITGPYLSGKNAVPIPKKRRSGKGVFTLSGIKKHNLKNITLSFPLGALTCLTGVSGSGKSTLMHEVIRPHITEEINGKRGFFDKMIIIDQNPIGHTVRSDVGTYVNVLPILRDFYSSLALSRMKGLQPQHFSYNHRRGMCTGCMGLGYKKVEMLFLPPVKIACQECKGLRLNPVSLEVEYKGKSFGKLLETTIDEASQLFEMIPKAKLIFDTLIACGLGYLTLGQEMVSLSGGEAQRIKLSAELAKRSTGKTLYLLDEPTTGLHFEDIKKLLIVLHKLVDKGNTMIIIEHNLDIIKNADYLIDLGPSAGEKGGQIVAFGTPEQVARHPSSLIAPFLKLTLNKN